MSAIDIKYKELLTKIDKEGFEYNDPNRYGVKRKQIPFYTLVHEFKDGFPIIGLKKSFPKAALGEFKAFMLGKTKLKELKELGVNFWDKDGLNFHKRKFPNSTITRDRFDELIGTLDYLGNEFGELGKIYPYQIRKWNGKLDQLKVTLNRLKHEPHTTKNIITMWNPSDWKDAALSSCHTRFSFVVEKGEDKNKLWIQWTQDSVDTFLGLPMNILYYSFACYVFAEFLGMEAKGIKGDLYNVHIYDNTYSKVKELIKKDANETKNASLFINLQEHVDIDKFIDSIKYNSNISINDYNHLGRLDAEMLAYE